MYTFMFFISFEGLVEIVLQYGHFIIANMDQQKIVSIGLQENQLEFQPLSTFDLDDEIAPQNVGVFALSATHLNQTSEKPIRPDICCGHAITRINEELSLIHI